MSAKDSNFSPVRLSLAIYLGIVGSSVLLVLPIFVASLVSGLNLSVVQAGWIGSADLVGYTMGSIVAYRIIKTTPWRHLVLIGLAMMLVGNLASAITVSFPLLFMTRVLLTGLGAGLVLSVPYAALGLMPNPEKSTGTYWTFNVLGGSLGLLLLPPVVENWGTTGLFLTLAMICVPALAFSVTQIHSPARTSKTPGMSTGAALPLSATSVILLAGIVLFNLGLGGVWAFVDRPFAALGLSFEQTGWILSGTYLVCMLGSSLAAWQGDRLGFEWPYVASMVVMAAALALLIFPPTIVGAVVALALVNFCWNYGMTYQFAGVYGTDESSRAAVLIIFAQSSGLMLGPGVAGMIAERSSYAAGLEFGIVLCILSAGVFLLSSRFK